MLSYYKQTCEKQVDEMFSQIQFVPATEADAGSVIALRREIWATTYRGIYPDSMIDDFDYAWHLDKELKRIRHPQYDVYLISKNGCNIGYLTIRKNEIITLQSLYVTEKFQNQGIGKLAFHYIMQFCKAHAFHSFICHCVPENWNARGFYEKMGGRVIGEDLDNEESWMNSVIYQFDF